MKTWKIPVSYQEIGYVYIDANTLEEAFDIACEECPEPEDCDYVDDSMDYGDGNSLEDIRYYYNDDEPDDDDEEDEDEFDDDFEDGGLRFQRAETSYAPIHNNVVHGDISSISFSDMLNDGGNV